MHALHAEPERLACALLRRDGRGERRALLRSLEARLARRTPRDRVAVRIRDRDGRVVERRADVRDALRFDYSLCFLASCHAEDSLVMKSRSFGAARLRMTK